MNRHKQARATILREAGRIPQGKKVGGRRSSIRTADYCTAAVPANLPAQPVGDCLIWTGPLNPGGMAQATSLQVSTWPTSRHTHSQEEESLYRESQSAISVTGRSAYDRRTSTKETRKRTPTTGDSGEAEAR